MLYFFSMLPSFLVTSLKRGYLVLFVWWGHWYPRSRTRWRSHEVQWGHGKKKRTPFPRLHVIIVPLPPFIVKVIVVQYRKEVHSPHLAGPWFVYSFYLWHSHDPLSPYVDWNFTNGEREQERHRWEDQTSNNNEHYPWSVIIDQRLKLLYWSL